MRFVLRSPTLARFEVFLAAGALACAADATSPLDPAARNAPYAPATTVIPRKQAPPVETNSRVQERRFDTNTVERQMAPVGDKQAAITVGETREKRVREKQSQRPERIEQPVSAYNQRQAGISTGSDTTKPPMVAKYQDSLAAASASNMARFPALDGSTSARINRFVFRRNPAEPDRALEGTAVTPAAGGTALRK